MPDLYVTPNGHWTGTQADAAKATRAEGSKPGTWKKVHVPTDKANLLSFLNKGWKAPEAPKQEVTAKPLPFVKSGERRWRVYVDKLFSFVVYAPSHEAAKEEAIAIFPERIRVHPVTAQ